METLRCGQLLSATLTGDDAAQLAKILKDLADPVRLQLVNTIATSGEACACDLPDVVGKTQATVSHHLGLLTRAGVLEREQRGRWAWFRVRPE